MLCNTNDPVEIFEQLNAYQAVTIDSEIPLTLMMLFGFVSVRTVVLNYLCLSPILQKLSIGKAGITY